MKPNVPTPSDVRMRGFSERAEVGAAFELLKGRVRPLPSISIPLQEARDRVLAEDVIAPVPVPRFDRAAMDGYAVRGAETFGADSYTPLDFIVIGVSLAGRAFSGSVQSRQAVRIMTGAPLPEGADCVVPVEATSEQKEGNGSIVRVTEAFPPGRHVGRVGEDIQEGSLLLSRGRKLRPQDLGVLASVGASPILVTRQPSVAILVSGDELLPCGSMPHGHQIVDSNSVMLQALAYRDGAFQVRIQMVPDGRAPMVEALTSATEDVILISGGSSVGQEDHAPRVLSELGELAIHGLALRPASPTGIGFLMQRPVFLLPGNPVSCLCAYDLFAGPALRLMGGRSFELPYRVSRLPLGRKLVSMVGRYDYVRVRVADGRVEPLAVSGASMLSSTTRADGFVLVPADLEGYPEGEEVEVYWYDLP